MLADTWSSLLCHDVQRFYKIAVEYGIQCLNQIVCLVVLQVKCLRVLQYFPVPDDPATNKALDGVLKRIITGTVLLTEQCRHCWSDYVHARF